jgi:hypothetical protein
MRGNSNELIQQIKGRRCRIETTEGGIRTEKVVRIGTQTVRIQGLGAEQLAYIPHTIFFDEGEVDGAELRVVKSIRVLD